MRASENMGPMLGPADRDRLLAHLGVVAPAAPDLAGLTMLQRAWLERIPFEALAAQLGEYAPLATDRLLDRFIAGRRGGYCFEVNGVFALLLESLGYAVERREAVVGPPGAHRTDPPNHLALVVATPDGPFIAEVGFGDGPLEPLPLAAGLTTFPHETFAVAREGGGWWGGRGPPPAAIGYRFADRTVGIDAFAPHHERMATSP